jgi:penicillin-binding protein 1A
VLAFAMGAYLGLVRAVNSLEEPSAVASHPTYIYSKPVGDTEGSTRVIGTMFQGENRRTASFEDMPPSLLDALVAKEDERFREHGGVDLWGIIRALWIDLLIMTDIRSDETIEGASTITQQYVKNAYLSGEPTLSRKLKEALIAMELERRYEKDEILGMYLNTVYFGNNAYGVEAAAETYFNKSTEDLTVGESATLIGLLWSPSTLGSDREEATNQRNIVLATMRDAGYITRQQHMEALDEDLPKTWPKAPMVETGLTSPQLTKNFAEFVREELVNRYGAHTVLAGGLSVYTTLDLKAQVEAQDILYGPNGYLRNPDDPDAALVSIEPDTGHITAMVGNRDQDSHFNLVTQAKRQPGSSFKPFALIAALEQGIDPSTQFVSEEKQYVVKDKDGDPEQWKVDNYEGENHGPISLEQALWFSDNSVFADLVTNADGRGLKDGPEAVADVAKRLGVSAQLDTHPSIALGTQEVSPLDMATAYATIANEGRKVTPTAIEKVVQNEGQEDEKTLYVAEPEEGEQVIDPEIARKATEIMVGDITQGIGYKASLGDRPAAGKSGTSENFFDSWFVGFTPQLVTGVWMGYAEGGRTLDGLLNIGGQQLGPLAPPTVIWQNYMQKVLQDKPIKKFEGIDASTGARSSTGTPGAATGSVDSANGGASSLNQLGEPVAVYAG